MQSVGYVRRGVRETFSDLGSIPSASTHFSRQFRGQSRNQSRGTASQRPGRALLSKAFLAPLPAQAGEVGAMLGVGPLLRTLLFLERAGVLNVGGVQTRRERVSSSRGLTLCSQSSTLASTTTRTRVASSSLRACASSSSARISPSGQVNAPVPHRPSAGRRCATVDRGEPKSCARRAPTRGGPP